MIIILVGILSSVAAELVTWLNKKLTNTVLRGDGAFILAFVLAFAGAFFKEVSVHGIAFMNWQDLSATFSEIFATSQVFFLFVVKKLNLDVQTPTQTQTEDVAVSTSTPSIPE